MKKLHNVITIHESESFQVNKREHESEIYGIKDSRRGRQISSNKE